MDKRTAIFALALLALLLWLLMPRRSRQETTLDPVKLPGVGRAVFVVPPIESALDPTKPHEPLWDWMNGEQCGCDGGNIDALVIDSAKIGKRPIGSYQFVPKVDPIPPALKSGLTFEVITPPPTVTPYSPPASPPYSPPPQPIVYRPAPPSFWWGWQGLSRVVYTSDGATLSAGMGNRKWKVLEGPGVMDEITAISYNGQRYDLDRSKSVGL